MTIEEVALEKIAYWLEQIGMVVLAQQDRTTLHLYIPMAQEEIQEWMREKYKTDHICQVCSHPKTNPIHLRKNCERE